MSSITLSGSPVSSGLQQILMADDIQPGSEPGYQTAKAIYLHHPLGGKLADMPIRMAQSKPREIAVSVGPEDELREAFLAEWKAINADQTIANLAGLARVYGIATMVYGAEGHPTDKAIDERELAKLRIYFNVLDPLNTAGSLVLNQDPNAPDFLKHNGVRVNGYTYHRERCCVLMNERPIYIAYTDSAFGFVGRSVYQRVLFPLKTFVQTMLTDDMVVKKSGVIIAKLRQPGGIIDGLMQAFAGQKATAIKQAVTDNVITIGDTESIESLNLQNLEGPFAMARDHALKNVAAGADMPALLLNDESFANGFGEGSEDAYKVSGYISGVRDWMKPAYDFIDPIVMRRAWNPGFYKAIQEKHDVWKNVDYEEAFYQFRNGFRPTWPDMIAEPESEKVKVEDVKFKAIIALTEVLSPQLDPENRAALIDWACDNFAENKLLFPHPLQLDMDALRAWTPPEPAQAEPQEAPPFSARDSADGGQVRLLRALREPSRGAP